MLCLQIIWTTPRKILNKAFKLEMQKISTDKKCLKCHAIKNQSEFYRGISKVRDKEYPRIRTECKKCQIKKSHENYFKNHAINKKKHNDWYHGRYRKQALKEKYGLTSEQFEEMKKAQDGLCAICQKTQRSFHVDHDHQTKKVRGLLCQICNVGLGYFHDDIKRLAMAITYLKKTVSSV